MEKEKSKDKEEAVEADAPQSADKAETGSTQAQDKQEGTEDDKFIQLTKKVTSSAEEFIGLSYKKAKDAVQSSDFEPRAVVRLIDKLLIWVRKTFPPTFFDTIADWLVRYGHAGLVAAQVLTILFGLRAAIKESNWIYAAYGVGLAVLLAILQYTADKFINAGKSLIESSPSRLRSSVFLDCLGLLTEVAGIMIFLKLCFQAKAMGSWSLALTGLGLWALCDGIAYIALNPGMVNISMSDEVGAGEEAVGIMSFFVKAVVRISPIAFGVGTIIGGILLLYGTVTGRLYEGFTALRLIVIFTCLPFGSYIFFAFYHLLIELMQAVLVLPGKIDKASGK